MKSRMISVIICVILIIGTTICIGAQSNVPMGYERVGETDTLELYYNDETVSIMVKDKRNGFIWGSSVDENYYDMDETNDVWKENMSSLFYINYTSDYKKINTTNSVAQKPTITSSPIEKGIAIEYDLTKIGIKISLEIWLDEKSVNIRIPVKGIDEYGNNKITSIDLLPFFGAASDLEDGYVFYPDGCGGIYHFKGKPEIMAERYSWSIYGYDKLDLDEVEKREKAGIKQAFLPVFGLKKGHNALVGIVTKGEYDTNINFYPSGFAVNLNRINTELCYRRMHKDSRPYATITDYIEKGMIQEDHEIKFTFLINENSNYSGMASAYREYLEATDTIQKAVNVDQKMPLWLDLFTGIKLDQVIFDKYIKMTTFGEAAEILRNFKNKGVDNIKANLIGWSKGGYGAFPESWSPEKAIGGISGLKSLARFTNNNNIELFLESNLIDALAENRGFSKRNDVVYHRNGLSVTDRKREKYILNPIKVFERFTKSFIPNLKKISISGLSFDRLGTYIYYDYHKSNPVTRNETAAKWSEIIEKTKKQIGSSAVRGGNAYGLKHADWLLDIPVNDSGYFITDESVPFYQMVVHGYIPYSSEAGNLFYDFQKQKLKWIEYGCMPYFKLTYQEPVLLRKTEYNHLFTSYYLHWIDEAVETYEELEGKFGYLWTQVIIRHEKVLDNVYKVTYKDGSKVYVNYNEGSVYIENQNINGMDYLVIDKEGKVK